MLPTRPEEGEKDEGEAMSVTINLWWLAASFGLSVAGSLVRNFNNDRAASLEKPRSRILDIGARSLDGFSTVAFLFAFNVIQFVSEPPHAP